MRNYMDYFNSNMKAISCLFFSFLFSLSLYAQEEKNYVLEINGDTVSASLGENIKHTLKDGKVINLKISRKDMMTFDTDVLSFKYPSDFSVTSTKIDEDVQQYLLMSAGGAGLMVQVYRSLNPEGIVDFFLDQITEDEKKAGYKETRKEAERKLSNGVKMEGKKSILKMDNDVSEFSVVGYGKGKKGILVIEINPGHDGDLEKKLFDTFWKSFQIKY
jgi:hypothetical protein